MTAERARTDDEIRRWFATEKLGWEFVPAGTESYQTHDKWTAGGDDWWCASPGCEHYEDRLSGWDGFGLVVEWAHKNGYDWTLDQGQETNGYTVAMTRWYSGENPNPEDYYGDHEVDPFQAAARAVLAASMWSACGDGEGV